MSPECPECRWCGAPATREVELEPAEVIRHRDGSLQFVRQSIKAPACARHPGAEQVPAPVTPHRTTAKADEVDQLELFSAPGSVPDSAIHGGR